jgi:peptide/nickel transport system permease protein
MSPTTEAFAEAAKRPLLHQVWRAIPPGLRTVLGIVCGIIATAWVVVCFLGTSVAPYDPLDQTTFKRFLAPNGVNWLGTDELNRDVFSRILAGAQVTIGLSLLLVLMSMVLGLLLGVVSGFFGGWVDEAIMRFTDLVMAFPMVILAMVTAAALGPSLFNAVLACLVVSWPQYARVVRSMVLSLRHEEFVASGRLLGFSALRSIGTDILPNVMGPTLVMATADIGTKALLLSGLSFLGLGATPPSPEWGAMISSAVRHFDMWWMGIFPGLALLTVVMSFNFIGDALRDYFDPKGATQ